MNPQLQKALIVFGVSAILFWLVRPDINRKPKTSDATTPEQQKKDAIVVANAYGKALQAKESPAALEELNKLMEGQYGLRVDRKHADGKYYVMDTKGNEVLPIT